MNSDNDVWSGCPSQWMGLRTYFWCSLLLPIFILIASVASTPGVPASKLTWLLPLLLVGIAVRRFFSIRSIYYRISTERLFIKSGLLSHRTIEIELFRIRDLSISQNFFGRWVNVGTIAAASADRDAPSLIISSIKNPTVVKESLRRFVMDARRATGTRDVDMSVTR